ncbi:hypothetical protein BO94DRAFT_535550 [Aspergillus sclerotioniger CBS 115572]|uniref:Large ribosomal subunit protein bL27m n=1 Tax=Aspergillus sclerotioniger CBS 115572 TaxID=1450535 RepID=A0A317WIW3_9EURO|nr:hypothetical protein BO94DRAFT_535550 [Aspergillus sclerotioniger CBS 115572]PWY86396.1 hypothetical protein BO94DRAFT_535550 [Aspergillus sclerotioniger CBS 115572]
MIQPRLLAPLRALERSIPSILRTTTPRTALNLNTTLLRTTLSTPTPLQQQIRQASHATQGTANRHSRDPAGKRLGAKRTSGEYVVPGCIIFRQRGTKWFPGENCAMGRDHTIYAAEAGYVRYYLDPERHSERKYIGVVFEKDGKLPVPRNAPSRRRLGRVNVKFEVEGEGVQKKEEGDLVAEVGVGKKVEDGGVVVGSVAKEEMQTDGGVQLRPGYMYREANWVIGRAAEKAGITAKVYRRKNRWLAWRKRTAKSERMAQMKSLKNKKKGAKKAKK